MNWTIHRRELRNALLWLMALIGAMCLARDAAAMTVKLDAKDVSSTVLLHPGDRLRVELPAASATGFRWKVKALDASHLELLSKDVRPDSPHLNASGTQIFVWKAVSAGQANLGIEYKRPGDDRTIAPAKRVAVVVEIAPAVWADAEGSAGTAEVSTLEQPLQPVATYRGSLRCEGCVNLAVELTLYREPTKSPDAQNSQTAKLRAEQPGTENPGLAKPDATQRGTGDGMFFVERRRYEGAPGGDRTIAGTGKLAVVHGTYADPAMTVYMLAAPDGSLENLRVDGDRLIPLDAQMLPVPLVSGSRQDAEDALKKVPPEGETVASDP